MQPSGIITLLTDFGTTDAFVGVMKGVILGFNPNAQIVDLCHEVPPQNVLHGAFLLRSAWRYFPEGTIHVAVVDPGVGSERRGVALECGGHRFVGPDNGVLTLAVAAAETRGVVITNSEYFLPQVSSTFHGRDLFAPVAAHLSLGLALHELGARFDDWQRLQIPSPLVSDLEVLGEVIHVDRFGNLITNIPDGELNPWPGLEPRHGVRITINGHTFLGIRNAYAEVEDFQPLAISGSAGLLEIAVRNGSAAQFFTATRGNPVALHPRSA